ncbi:sugar-binding transcriptional regulator [Paracoccus aminophilus]|uniref:Transcriptional regulator, DeoR family n=1 Tax=Paracoccus aminophilus JCM 7686 TaxID=1367847 RepID=S5Y4R3_PARAH|nr:sugar-binding transcriptional regulator [Paracoccus aminophilus]AGT10730.1 transcriptional regulator, DeoR family [Paracoccus aminophilus JCM 7686]
METANTELDDALIARVAWLYYNSGLTQSEIGEMLALSRIKVSRMLEQGRDSGLIQIRVNSLHHGCFEQEERLRQRFGLSDCRVIPEGAGAPVNARLGEAAAQYLMQKLEPGSLLAVGWGDTVSRTIRKLGHVAEERGIGLVTLTGGVQTYVDGMRTANWGHNVFVVPAPLLVSTPALSASLAAERSVATLLSMALGADYKLVGIGGIADQSTVVTQGFISPAEVEPLRRLGAVGDILCRFYDRDGRQLDLPIHERVIGVGLDKLKDSARVIGVAGGAEKVEPIRAALKGALLDILITDEATASQLLMTETD